MGRLRIPVGTQDHIQGQADARVVLVEYGDYQCPYCGMAHGMLKQVQQRFGQDVALVFRNFPLVNAHPEALNAAIVAEYAGTHGRFWEVHDALFEHQQALGPALYVELMRQLGLPLDGLQQALEGGGFVDDIQAQLEGGIRSGVNGTPTFFINGQRFDGSFMEIAGSIQAVIEAG